MPYNLFVTSSSGRTFKSLNSPYIDRVATRSTVCRIVVDSIPISDEDEAFVNWVESAPLGLTVTHETTGVSFRTEET